MNLILFEPGELPGWLPLSDARAAHLTDILKLAPGERFLAGEVDGPWGTAGYLERGSEGLRVGEALFDRQPPALSDVRLVIGTPRPPTARRLLRDLATLGAAELHFVASELGDKSYLQSTLWKTDWREALKEGAAQNRGTRLPAVHRHERLASLLRQTAPGVCFQPGGVGWHEHPALAADGPLWLAVGPERGWTEAELARFDAAFWSRASLGPAVLRTETACTLALGVARLSRLPNAPSPPETRRA